MVQRLIVGIHQHHHVKETTPTGSVFFVACNYVSGLQLEGMSLTRMLNLDQLVPTKNLPTMILMNNDFNGLMPQVKRLTSGNNSFFFANANRSSAEGAVAISQT
ncbi:BnaA06g02690D [Brassica napus]|uniref:BnaA06g02690D protein n=1 Tax=Brassica napus TaxID=3708 RepID=A0A078GDT6_BRANA|nr:BnaA06g02690D [Brassica napus]